MGLGPEYYYKHLAVPQCPASRRGSIGISDGFAGCSSHTPTSQPIESSESIMSEEKLVPRLFLIRHGRYFILDAHTPCPDPEVQERQSGHSMGKCEVDL